MSLLEAVPLQKLVLAHWSACCAVRSAKFLCKCRPGSKQELLVVLVTFVSALLGILHLSSGFITNLRATAHTTTLNFGGKKTEAWSVDVVLVFESARRHTLVAQRKNKNEQELEKA